MFKRRLKKWNLRKSNKKEEVIPIMRTKKERDAVGKDSEFWRRGKKIDLVAIQRYHRQIMKASPELEAEYFELPKWIEVRTPSPELRTPEPFNRPEEILWTIRDYINYGFSSGNWITDSTRTRCWSRNGRQPNLDDFTNNFEEGCSLIRSPEKRKQGFDMLRIAFSQLNRVLLQEPPRLLTESITLMCQTKGFYKNPEMGDMLLKYLQELSSIVLGEFHHLTRIWRHVLTSVAQWGDAVHELVCRCARDQFEQHLGPVNRTTILAYFNHGMVARYADGGGEAEELILRELFAKTDPHDKPELIISGRIRLQLAWNLY
jgi:hypothetical protein